MAELDFAGSPELAAALADAASHGFVPEEQTIAKLRSTSCDEAFDLHLAPVAAVLPDSLLAGRVLIAVGVHDASLARAAVARRHRSRAAPLIDHGYLSDPEGADLAVHRGRDRQGPRALARSSAARQRWSETRSAPLAGLEGEALADGIRRTHVHYYHPVGTARMGADGDELAVCEPTGRVRGSDRLWVADCSLIPTIPRANTNIPAVVVGERVAQALARRPKASRLSHARWPRRQCRTPRRRDPRRGSAAAPGREPPQDPRVIREMPTGRRRDGHRDRGPASGS